MLFSSKTWTLRTRRVATPVPDTAAATCAERRHCADQCSSAVPLAWMWNAYWQQTLNPQKAEGFRCGAPPATASNNQSVHFISWSFQHGTITEVQDSIRFACSAARDEAKGNGRWCVYEWVGGVLTGITAVCFWAKRNHLLSTPSKATESSLKGASLLGCCFEWRDTFGESQALNKCACHVRECTTSTGQSDFNVATR